MFARQPDGALCFHPLPPPTDDDVHAVCARIARRVHAAFDDDPATADPATADLAAALQPFLPRVADDLPARPARSRTALCDGLSLHADTAVAAHDRAGLERLLRYGLRPAFAQSRLSLTPAGNVSYRLRRPWFNGQTHVTLPPTAVVRRIA